MTLVPHFTTSIVETDFLVRELKFGIMARHIIGLCKSQNKGGETDRVGAMAK